MALRLQQKLTQRLTAYMVDLADGRDIGRYARGERKPHPGTQMKLRDLFSLVSMLTEREDAETIQAWFMGRNPELKHRAPALLLHENFNVNYEQVRKAAIKFSGRYPLTS